MNLTKQRALLAIFSVLFVGLIAGGISQSSAKKAVQNDTAATFVVKGMVCGGCVARITDTMKKFKGVKTCKVTLKPPHAVITYDAKQTNTKAMMKKIASLGYKVSLLPKKKEAPAKPKS
ncbi:MAG: hypothetical protein CL920_17425 [Deltaproteobacteria bacterium]|nr:hypothetical protein [Deltaproteobacteria bacterium]|tara:strand:- start:3250 stop:3606 length:357 start_codon:yes stop_codon:yes gene_type:complete